MRIALCCVVIGILTSMSCALGAGLFGYPLHASCRIQWTFGKPCQAVLDALINQMDVWKTGDNCGTGQKCLYKYISSTATTLTGTHETPVRHYIDDLSFTFKPSGNVCDVEGFSSSQLWYAVLDLGTNYCNLHNLIEGAKLDMDANYSESTRDAVCTQFSSSNCQVY